MHLLGAVVAPRLAPLRTAAIGPFSDRGRGEVLNRDARFADVPRPPRRFDRRMTELHRHWLAVLDTTVAAVNDAVRAHGMPATESAGRLGRLRSEREWVEKVDWDEVAAVAARPVTPAA